MNSKIEKVDSVVYTKFVGDVKADLNFIKASKPVEDDGTPVVEPKFNDRFQEKEHQNDDQNKMLQNIEDQKNKEKSN